MSEPHSFNPVDGADYLAVGRAGVCWLMAAEVDPDTPDEAYEPEWSLVPMGGGDRATQGALDLLASDVADIVRDAIEAPIESYPCSHYDQGVTLRPETSITDAALTGIFQVRYESGADGCAYSEGVIGYRIFVTQPDGYVMVVVERTGGIVGLEAVLRPSDKPDDMPMMTFLDATFAELRIERLDHQLRLHP